MQPFDPTNQFGPIMLALNEGPASVWLEHHQGKKLMGPGDGLFFTPHTIAIGVIEGEESASVQVLLWSPDNVTVLANATQAPATNADTIPCPVGSAKMSKWKVSQLYKSSPREFVVSNEDDGWCIFGAPDPDEVVEKYGISLMLILNDGPGAALVKASGKKGITLEAKRAILVPAGRTEVAMMNGESANINIDIFSNSKYRTAN